MRILVIYYNPTDYPGPTRIPVLNPDAVIAWVLRDREGPRTPEAIQELDEYTSRKESGQLTGAEATEVPVDKLFLTELINGLALLAFGWALLVVLAGVKW